MIETISYGLGLTIMIIFLYFMWIDTKPLNHKPHQEK